MVRKLTDISQRLFLDTDTTKKKRQGLTDALNVEFDEELGAIKPALGNTQEAVLYDTSSKALCGLKVLDNLIFVWIRIPVGGYSKILKIDPQDGFSATTLIDDSGQEGSDRFEFRPSNFVYDAVLIDSKWLAWQEYGKEPRIINIEWAEEGKSYSPTPPADGESGQIPIEIAESDGSGNVSYTIVETENPFDGAASQGSEEV